MEAVMTFSFWSIRLIKIVFEGLVHASKIQSVLMLLMEVFISKLAQYSHLNNVSKMKLLMLKQVVRIVTTVF
jgi:hypothetical protein